MEEGYFDVIVAGTGLLESMTAAALSKAGFSVAHVDVNPYYGGDEACLTVDELSQWADQRSDSQSDPSNSPYRVAQARKYTSFSKPSSSNLPQSKAYSLSLLPSLVPSTGPHISSLIASGVARYGSYRLLERVGIYTQGQIKPVPGSKEDVFKSKDLSLVEKRRLMRFLMFAAGEFEGKKELEGKEQMGFVGYLKSEFSLKDVVADAIAFALAFCARASDPTLPALHRIRRFLRSSGRYGSSPFLVGHYGGSGEIAQGFCRVSAVAGGIYILGHDILSIERCSEEKKGNYSVRLEGLDDPITSELLISSSDYLSPESDLPIVPVPPTASSELALEKEQVQLARCIAILDKPLHFPASASPPPPSDDPSEEGSATSGEDQARENDTGKVDTAVLIFPPSSLPGGSTTESGSVFVTGEGSMSAPSGKYILYIALPLPASSSTPTPSPEELLTPYLDAALKFTSPSSNPSEDTSSSTDAPQPPPKPFYTLFYLQHPAAPPTPQPSKPGPEPYQAIPPILLTPPHSQHLATAVDSATTNAESVFWEAVKRLKTSAALRPKKEEGEEEGREIELDSFWPPLEGGQDDEEDW